MPVELILIVVLVGAGYLFYRDVKSHGKESQENKSLRGTLKNVDKADKAIVRARDDKSITDKLRAKYNIK